MSKNNKTVDLFQLNKALMHISGSNTQIKHQHIALIWYIIEKSNSLRWEQEFTLFTEAAMHYAGFTNGKTYNRTLNEIESLGLIKIKERCINQHTKNVIEMCWGKFDEALSKQSNSKAKATTEQGTGSDSALPCIKNNKDLIKHIKQNKLFNFLEKDFFKTQLLEKSKFKEFMECFSENSDQYAVLKNLFSNFKPESHA